MFRLFLISLVLIIRPIFGLYEDQANKIEWVKKHIGFVEHMVFDKTNSPSRKVIVSTDQNVVAALNSKNGEIVWRHILEPPAYGKISTMQMKDHFVAIIMGNLVRTWDTITAALKEEVLLHIPLKRSDAHIRLTGFGKFSEVVHSVDMTDSAFELATLDSKSGEMLHTHTVAIPPSFDKYSKCELIEEMLVCLDTKNSLVYSVNVESQSPEFVNRPLSSLGMPAGAAEGGGVSSLSRIGDAGSYLSVKVGNENALLHTHADGVHSTLNLNYFQALTVDGDWVYAINQKLNSVTLKTFEVATGREVSDRAFSVDLPAQSGAVRAISVQRFTRKDGTSGLRALIVCSDHSIHLIGDAGVIWSREESLAAILALESIDLPVGGLEETFQELVENEDASIVTNFINRIRNQFHHFLAWIQQLLRSRAGSNTLQQSLKRDQFNMNKIMVVVTRSGKIMALDTRVGEVVWSVFIPVLAPFKNGKFLLFTQRTSAHYPNNPQCVVVGTHADSGNGVLYTFNPLTGQGMKFAGSGGDDLDGLSLLPFRVLLASPLPHADESHLKPLLVVDAEHRARVYPESSRGLVYRARRDFFVHVAEPDSASLKGFSFKDSTLTELRLTEVWRTSLGKDVVIEGVFGKRPTERVHSQGRVLADRSVLYKYSNPNLAVVTTRAKNDIGKHPFTVHLIDTVTGAFIESVVHKRVTGPFHVVHSENWVIYTYFNEKFRRHEVVTLELFEGLTQSNVSAFSSFGDKATPFVEKQAFIIPQGIQAATHTTTEKAITTKYILFALSTGNVLQISKWFLDPRRPITPSAPREEELTPYMPEVPVAAHEMINHNVTLSRVAAIYTAPTGLESTCLVLVYGLDVFYTRVFPSKMFDVLKDDFDHYLIICALGVLSVAALVSRKLSQRKALNQAWK